MSDVEATTPEPAQPQKQAEEIEQNEQGSGEDKPTPEAGNESTGSDKVDDCKVWYYGRYTPSGRNFRRIVEVNPKNRHETQLIELDEGTSLGSMVYSQGKLHLVS